MKLNPPRWTMNPSGTTMSIPPMIATAVIVSSGPSISALRRSRSIPPMKAKALSRPFGRHRPLRDDPDSTATSQPDAGTGLV